MATTFLVFSLGAQQIWDPAEGNQNVSTAAVDSTLGVYGSAADPLFNNIQEFAPAGNGFAGGDPNNYDLDNNSSNDQFSIDGGATQTFDAAMVFNAVITYKNGGAANITAVVFQDSNGETYWAPEITANGDQAAIEAAAIQSLELVSPIYAQGVNGQAFNLTADRQVSDLICFARGAMIACPGGERPVEDLRQGDLVLTLDHGVQPIQWIGRREVAAIGAFAPVRIAAGTLGATHPLLVSPQHRMLLSGHSVALTCGVDEGLAAAKHLVDGRRVSVCAGGEIEYFHLLFENHEILWANGALAESLFLGPANENALDAESITEINALFPEAANLHPANAVSARPILKAHEARLAWSLSKADRHMKAG